MLSLSAIRARQRSVSPVSRKENEEKVEDVGKENILLNNPLLKTEEKENKKESKCEKIMYSLFIEHPVSVNMNYFEHFMRGMSLAFQSGVATCALLVHSVVPKFFPSAGSSIIMSLAKEIEEFKKKSK